MQPRCACLGDAEISSSRETRRDEKLKATSSEFWNPIWTIVGAMASATFVRAENGKDMAFSRPNLSSSTDRPRQSQSVCSMKEEDLPSSSPSNPAPLNNIDSRNLSLIPYVPSILAQLRSSFETKPFMNGDYGATPDREVDLEEDRKRDREHKKRSKNWTRQETLMLIRRRTELAPRFAMIGRKTELWDEIAKALQRERFCRDAQQCRDKWEKLMAGYKEVRYGSKDRRDNPFFDELHPLLSGRPSKKEKERENNSVQLENAPKVEVGADMRADANTDTTVKEEIEVPMRNSSRDTTPEEEDRAPEERTSSLRKRKRSTKFVAAVTDLHTVQMLLETILSRQQRYFKDLLDAMERREQLREQMRQEREEKWRAEERAQRCIFNNTMLVLTQKLVGERVGVAAAAAGFSGALVSSPFGNQGPKKRSKNWKRAEVLQLIKLRGEMESKFTKSTRRATLWDELAEQLRAQGIKRDGKQCKEKWDKLMSEYKDVLDGRREQGDSPYFADLTTIVGGKPEEAG